MKSLAFSLKNAQENDWEMKRSTINLKGVLEKRLCEEVKKVALIV